MPAAPATGSGGFQGTRTWYQQVATEIGNFFNAVGAVLNIGGNSIRTTTYTIRELSDPSTSNLAIEQTPTSGNTNAYAFLLPSGTGNTTYVNYYDGSDPATNARHVRVGISNGDAFIGSAGDGVGVSPDFNIYPGAQAFTFGIDGSLTLPLIADIAAAAGKAWRSTTNADVVKYSNASTLFSLTSTKSATNTATSAAPTATVSATAVMMAVGGALTPANTGRVLITLSGQMANDTINDGATVQLRYGTGAAPANGDAVTGTQVGVSQTFTALVAAQRDGFCISGVVTGLTIGTAIWIDAALNRVTGGSAAITGVTVSTAEF